MDNTYEQDDKNENSKKKGTTIKSLVSFLTTTCFSRINCLSPGKTEAMKDKLKEMLDREEQQHRGEKERYEYLRNAIDLFFEYITDDRVADRIRNKKVTKVDLEEEFLSKVMNIPKRKYDMSDLYRSTVIASVNENSDIKKAIFEPRLGTRKDEYIDEEGRKFILSEVGIISYQEWSGIKSDLTMYQLQKELPDGASKRSLICTNIIIPAMYDQKYRKAVLGELLSDENISKSNVSPYVGQIIKRKKSNPNDLPRTETQNVDGYTYRVNDEYVLEYDTAELTAVIDAVRQYVNRQNMHKKNYSGRDEHDGR